MPEEKIKKKKTGFLILFGCLLLVLGAIMLYRNFYRNSILPESDNSSLQAKIAEASETGQMKQESESTGKEDSPEQENLSIPLSDAPLKPSDIYAEKDSTVLFSCFYPDAVKYTWEIYDMRNGWQEASMEDISFGEDELNRKVSSLRISAVEENNELTLRCTTDFADTAKEPVTDTAVLYVLDKKIADISAEDFTSDSGFYISAKDIPLHVIYQDGSREEITGLNNLYFLETAESSEQSTTISGNTIETITKVITACNYFYMESREKETVMRFQGADKNIEIPIKLIGEDLSAPVISQLNISEYVISTVDKPVPVTVSIQAEDNATSYPNLEYAFLPEGLEPEEDDWTKKPSFDTEITQNGKWIAYCRDESGNIGTSERDIIAVDNKAPIVSLKLENESWCQKNKILVNATDGLPVEYSYSCAQTGEESGWISRNEYDVEKNSTWKVRVRDAAGNITEQEITISNIDNQLPVIIKITEKEGEITNHENEKN